MPSRGLTVRVNRRPAELDLGRLTDGTLVVVAITYGLLLVLAGGLGLVGLIARIFVPLSVCRYAYEVLSHVARGRKMIPAPGLETMNPVGNFGLVLHFIFFGGLAVLFATSPLLGSGPGAALVSAAGLTAVAVAFPASATVIALTGDLGEAFDPRNGAEIVRAIGVRRYGAILAIGAALVFVPSWLAGAVLPAAAARALTAPVQIWAWLAVFALIGAAVRSRRDVIEIPGEAEPEEERSERDRHRAWQTYLDRAYASIRSGLVDEGYRTIRQLLDEAGMTDEVHEWVLDHMLAWEDRTHGFAFANRCIGRLLESGRAPAAVELAARCASLDRRFRPDPGVARVLAEHARSVGRHALADELAKGLPQAPG
ncbi:MAG TPA: hypothetical protein VF329_01325 [Gammaproteobacteria bacterium]